MPFPYFLRFIVSCAYVCKQHHLWMQTRFNVLASITLLISVALYREWFWATKVIFLLIPNTHSYPSWLKSSVCLRELKVRGNVFLEIVWFWDMISCEPFWSAEFLWIIRNISLKIWPFLSSTNSNFNSLGQQLISRYGEPFFILLHAIFQLSVLWGDMEASEVERHDCPRGHAILHSLYHLAYSVFQGKRSVGFLSLFIWSKLPLLITHLSQEYTSCQNFIL